MIVFDLKCRASGHVFEAWFGSTADYEDQRVRGLVACPICGDDGVEKAVMAPAVSVKGNRVSSPSSSTGIPVVTGAQAPARVKELLGKLAKEQAKMLEKSDYVGKDFANRARAMHEGDEDHSPIHGETSLEEAKALLDDGVPVSSLPLPVRPPKSDN